MPVFRCLSRGANYNCLDGVGKVSSGGKQRNIYDSDLATGCAGFLCCRAALRPGCAHPHIRNPQQGRAPRLVSGDGFSPGIAHRSRGAERPTCSASIHVPILAGLLIMVVFMLSTLCTRRRHRRFVVFPLVFLLTFVAATGQQPWSLTSIAVKRDWSGRAYPEDFNGYAALFLSFVEHRYLLQKRAEGENQMECLRACPPCR